MRLSAARVFEERLQMSELPVIGHWISGAEDF
jgi:hypothetical protein